MTDKNESSQKKRFAYDDDGAFDYGDPAKGGREMLYRLVDSYADADAAYLAFGAGNSAFTYSYRSDVLPVQGEHVARENLHEIHYIMREMVFKYVETGTDPLEIVTQQARKRKLPVLVNFRINRGFKAQGSESEHMNTPWFHEHPALFLKSLHLTEMRLNFALPEVRDYHLEIYKEILEKYDVDGLQLEFMRGVPFFDPEQGDKFTHMNTFLTDLKSLMERMGREQNRSYKLGIAFFTPTSGKYQRPTLITDPVEAGLDVESWVKDKLVDVLLPATWTAYEAVPNKDVDVYREMVAGTPVELYAYVATDEGFRSEHNREIDPVVLHELATQDAGVFVFNSSPKIVADLMSQIRRR